MDFPLRMAMRGDAVEVISSIPDWFLCSTQAAQTGEHQRLSLADFRGGATRRIGLRGFAAELSARRECQTHGVMSTRREPAASEQAPRTKAPSSWRSPRGFALS